MSWTTFSKTQTQTPQKTLVPGTFSAPTTVTVPNAVGGIELVPEDLVNTTRYLNLSIENKADKWVGINNINKQKVKTLILKDLKPLLF